MGQPALFSILLDGGFVLRKFRAICRRDATAADIVEVCNRLSALTEVREMELLRIYYYDARPASDTITNPLSHEEINLAATPVYRQRTQLLDRLELEPDFALRLGETTTNQWQLGSRAYRAITREPREIEPDDLIPNIQQKGVDLRVGLDIARLSLNRLVRSVVVVTGDSDFVPAFSFARREGVRVYLVSLEHGIRRELKAHADRHLEIDISDMA